MTTTQSNPVASTDHQHPQIVSALCQDLGEQLFTGPHRQILLIVQIIGGQAAQELAQRAHAIYDGEGMMTGDKTRRRTLGGVFFALFKQQCTPEQLHQFYQLRYEASAVRREHDGHDKSAPAAAATKPEKPQAKPVGARTTAPAAPVVSKKPVAPVKAGQAEGKRKPMEPAVNHRKSGKVER